MKNEQVCVKSKERLYGADFVRVYATLSVFLFHAFWQLRSFNSGEYPFILYANGGFGFRGTTIFFALSGAMLQYNNASVKLNTKEVGDFYKKRWLSILPAFFVVWLGVYIRNVLRNRSLFYAGNPFSLILTFLGVDGYFQYLIPNYHTVGEWFLGAIIILYLLFPLINACFQKDAHITLIVAILCSWLAVGLDFWKIVTDKNLFICCLSFVFGMYYMKYRQINKITLAIAVGLDIVLLFIPISKIFHTNFYIRYYIQLAAGYVAFITLYELGVYIMKNEVIKRMICFLSSISYETFLVHHVVIYDIINDTRPMSLHTQCAFVIYALVYSVAMGWLVHSIVKYIKRKIRKSV